jgi:hypothetical protein
MDTKNKTITQRILVLMLHTQSNVMQQVDAANIAIQLVAITCNIADPQMHWKCPLAVIEKLKMLVHALNEQQDGYPNDQALHRVSFSITSARNPLWTSVARLINSVLDRSQRYKNEKEFEFVVFVLCMVYIESYLCNTFSASWTEVYPLWKQSIQTKFLHGEKSVKFLKAFNILNIIVQIFVLVEHIVCKENDHSAEFEYMLDLFSEFWLNDVSESTVITEAKHVFLDLELFGQDSLPEEVYKISNLHLCSWRFINSSRDLQIALQILEFEALPKRLLKDSWNSNPLWSFQWFKCAFFASNTVSNSSCESRLLSRLLKQPEQDVCSYIQFLERKMHKAISTEMHNTLLKCRKCKDVIEWIIECDNLGLLIKAIPESENFKGYLETFKTKQEDQIDSSIAVSLMQTISNRVDPVFDKNGSSIRNLLNQNFFHLLNPKEFSVLSLLLLEETCAKTLPFRFFKDKFFDLIFFDNENMGHIYAFASRMYVLMIVRNDCREFTNDWILQALISSRNEAVNEVLSLLLLMIGKEEATSTRKHSQPIKDKLRNVLLLSLYQNEGSFETFPDISDFSLSELLDWADRNSMYPGFNLGAVRKCLGKESLVKALLIGLVECIIQSNFGNSHFYIPDTTDVSCSSRKLKLDAWRSKIDSWKIDSFDLDRSLRLLIRYVERHMHSALLLRGRRSSSSSDSIAAERCLYDLYCNISSERSNLWVHLYGVCCSVTGLSSSR